MVLMERDTFMVPMERDRFMVLMEGKFHGADGKGPLRVHAVGAWKGRFRPDGVL